MKMFAKLALVSSMAISANAMAMQSMDDAALSAATGQDGINIGLGITSVTIDKLLIHDNTGYADNGGTIGTDIGAGGTGVAGAIVVNNISITPNTDNSGAELLASHNLADLTIDTDAGTTANGGAFLNIAAAVSGLNISLGEIAVSASGDSAATGIQRGNDSANYNAILSGLSIKTGKMDANIQLGAAPQGAMIKLDTTLASGLEITNLGILDKSTIGQTTLTGGTSVAAGEIHLDSIKVADHGVDSLTVAADISVVGESAAGNDGYLKIISKAPATGTDIYITGVHLGGGAGSASIGDVEIQGLKTTYSGGSGAAITISGH